MGEDVVLTIESPSMEYISRASPNGAIGETGELASLVVKLSYKDFDILLTGDAQVAVLEEFALRNEGKIEVIQVPHHGSATGLNKAVLDGIAPQAAVISVGRKNKYGHPNKQVLSMVKERGVRVLRTDLSGNVEIISDGKVWGVK